MTEETTIFGIRAIIEAINSGAHRSEVTLFWGRFGCYNKKLSSRIIKKTRGATSYYF